MIHELKTWPKYYIRVFEGEKNFELRKDDRGFETGDILKLMEYDPENNQYTGRILLRKVTYILRDCEFGLPKGYVIMSLSAT